MHHANQEDQQQDIVAVVEAVQVEKHQRRNMGQAEDANHRHPLCFGGAFQKVRGLAAEAGNNRQYQKAVNRNKNAEHAVPAVIDEIVLHRQQQVKADHHAVIVAAAAIDEGHEFAQCGK